MDARFDCPQARCIAMTIVAGEGAGSVVETHGTALGPDRCRITEAVFATWSRPGFAVARRLGALIAPYVRFAARRLWVEDAAYCERRHALRREAAERRPSGHTPSCQSEESPNEHEPAR